MRVVRQFATIFRGSHLTFTSIGLAFILLGIMARILTQGISGFIDSIPDTIISIGVSTLAISIVGFIWAEVGDDPISRKIDGVLKLVELFSDSRKTGIVRIHERRRFYENERQTWLWEKIQNANKVDLMGRVLYRDWASEDGARKALKAALQGNCAVRILLLDPNGPMVQRRNKAEAENRGVGLGDNKSGRVVEGVREAVDIFRGFIGELSIEQQRLIELRVIGDIEMFAQIVRVDDYAWVQPYLYHATGGESISLERVMDFRSAGATVYEA